MSHMTTDAFRARIRAKRNPQTGAPQVTLLGDKRRVHIHVYDFTDSSIEAWRNDAITFAVYALPASAPKSTAFCRGRRLYDGKDATEALEAAMRAFGWELHPDEDFPPWLAKYWRDE